MFCPNCACELPAVAKFCVKCGSRIKAPPNVRLASVIFCMNCAKPLELSDKFCSACGQKVMRPADIQETSSEGGKKNIEKQAEHYSRQSNDDLVRLSAEFSDLTETAQRALVGEMAKRGLRPTVPIPEPPITDASASRRSDRDESLSWDYEKMSDEELQQLCTAYKRLQKQIPDSLRDELAVRASGVQAVSMPSPAPTQVGPQPTTVAQAMPETTQASTSVNSKSAPYAKFVVQLLLACLSASVGIFAFFDASARNSSALAVEALSGVLAIVFGWLSWMTYKVIADSESKSEPGRSRKALVTSLVLILLYLGLAALLGSLIGENRAEAIQLNSDIEHQKELADRITKARNAVSDSIQSYLDVYAEIDSDVKDYSSTLLRLRQEVSLYNGKFPQQAASMRSYANTIEKEIRRSDLLKRQVASAKHIASLDAYQRVVAWRSDMVPILEEEDALDKSK